jgi:hypothetical protein
VAGAAVHQQISIRNEYGKQTMNRIIHNPDLVSAANNPRVIRCHLAPLQGKVAGGGSGHRLAGVPARAVALPRVAA